MHKYHFVAKGVAPKIEALAIAQADLAETQRILDAAKKRLQEVEEGIATLQAKYEDCVRKKDELEQKTVECEQRLVRADKVLLLLRYLVNLILFTLLSMECVL
jgi:dynein heavy chain